jgi:hypothetical protein
MELRNLGVLELQNPQLLEIKLAQCWW